MKERLVKITIENIGKDTSKKQTVEIRNHSGWVILIVGVILLVGLFKNEIFHILSTVFSK